MRNQFFDGVRRPQIAMVKNQQHADSPQAYVLFAFTPLLGYSLSLLWPAFLTIPFAILQIYWLRNIALGAKPIWTLLSVNAIAIFGLTAYFLTLTFWLR